MTDRSGYHKWLDEWCAARLQRYGLNGCTRARTKAAAEAMIEEWVAPAVSPRTRALVDLLEAEIRAHREPKGPTMAKRTLKELIQHHEKQAQFWESKAKEYAAKAAVARERAARMKREAEEATR